MIGKQFRIVKKPYKDSCVTCVYFQKDKVKRNVQRCINKHQCTSDTGGKDIIFVKEYVDIYFKRR